MLHMGDRTVDDLLHMGDGAPDDRPEGIGAVDDRHRSAPYMQSQPDVRAKDRKAGGPPPLKPRPGFYGRPVERPPPPPRPSGPPTPRVIITETDTANTEPGAAGGDTDDGSCNQNVFTTQSPEIQVVINPPSSGLPETQIVLNGELKDHIDEVAAEAIVDGIEETLP